MTVYRDTDGPLPVTPLHGDYYYDPKVVERASLNSKYGASFKNPWLVQYHSGFIEGFPDERSAYRHLRIHRAKHGRHPDTGDKL